MNNEVKVFVERCREDIELPAYARTGDAGMDVRAAEDIFIKPSETKIVPTGLKMAIPIGYEVQVRPRSGLSFKTPLRVSNSPGTIDSGYRNEIGIIIQNTSNAHGELAPYTVDTKGNKQGDYIIHKGDRIAQLVLKEVPVMFFEEVDDVSTIGWDRGGGFGHSGHK